MKKVVNNKVIAKQFKGELPKPGKTGVDWFLFCYFLNLHQGTRMLEVGAGIGGSLCSMLAFSNQVTVIDSWNQNWPKKPVEDCVSKIGKQVKFIDAESKDVGVSDLETYAFIHLDANKGFDLVTKDLEIATQCCNGIICVDDYMNSMWPEVTWAVDEFVKTNKSWKKILIGNHQVFLSQKKYECKDLVIDLPMYIRDDILCLTYGKMPAELNEFVLHGKMQYSWHNIAWIEGNNDL